ncbi:MAG: hypothetical protein WEB88_12365 [Gemmatimonadota bacterium]
MQVKLALVADYANVTAEGKLNILGIFDRIHVGELPALHPQMHFILRLQAHPAERDRQHAVEIKLHDPDGQTVFQVQGEIHPRSTTAPGAATTNQILTLNNLQLTKTGGYTFIVFVDNDLKSEVSLDVVHAAGRGEEPSGEPPPEPPPEPPAGPEPDEPDEPA